MHIRTARLIAMGGLAVLATTAQAVEPGKAKPMARHKQVAHGLPASHAPLRFDAPGAGPTAAQVAYEACIDHPSPDGLTMDCQALREPATLKPRRKR